MSIRRLTVVVLAVSVFGAVPASAKNGPLEFAGTALPLPGGLEVPMAVAVDQANGDVYVSNGEKQIAVFNATNGKYLSSMECASCAEVRSLAVDEATGVLYYGSRVGYTAVDNSQNPFDHSAGDIYTSESREKGSVDLRSPLGEPMNFTAKEPYLEGSTLIGVPGSKEESLGRYFKHFLEPQRLAVNSANGDLYVNEREEVNGLGQHPPVGRVEVFSPTGEFLYSMAQLPGNTLSRGTSLLGIAVDGVSGRVYVTQDPSGEGGGGSFLDVFSYAGVLENHLTGTSSGEFGQVSDVAVDDASGYVYVVDRGLKQVDVFKPGPVLAAGAPESLGPAILTPSSALIALLTPAEAEGATYQLEYGLNTSYGHTIPVRRKGASLRYESESLVVEMNGLESAQIYHYRLDATDSAGTTYGSDETFTTDALKPQVSTGAAQGVGQSTATLTGTLDAQGAASTYWFQYGTSENYGTSAPAGSASAGSLSATVGESVSISSLTPGTTYHFRLVSNNAGGTEYGADQLFTTARAAGGGGVLGTMMARVGRPPKERAIPKVLTRAQKFAKALRACVKKPTKQRAACVKRARGMYGAKKGGKSTSSGRRGR
jgi:hypothetical protein